MPDPPKEYARLAALLPDVPRFVETRGMLVEGRCEVLGLEWKPRPSFVTRAAEALPGWEALPVVAHLLGESERLPEAPEGAVRFLSGPEEIGRLPPGLRAELERALRGGTPVAAAFVGGAPVSFCYAGWETEGLWDVSIDTLDRYRRRGYAAWCAAYAIRHMRILGKQPAWHALESNTASMELAARLGFVPVDRFFLFEPARSA
jgi:GNAT superfamily N-acetyltransferase